MKRPAALWLMLMAIYFLPSTLFAALPCDTTVQAGESIQDAIDAASAGEVICIDPGTYEEHLIINSEITLQGGELARTIIEGDGTGTVISASDFASTIDFTNILNVTIRNGQTGIDVQNVTNFTVTNVIVVNNETGVNCIDSRIFLDNVVIYQNTTGIIGDSTIETTQVTLGNSILLSNTTDISVSTDTLVAYNSSVFDDPLYDPLFVNPNSNDFHLKAGSPAIDAGIGTDSDDSSADIGAYGGPDMDERPFPITDLSATAAGTNSLDLSWSANQAYGINGYKVYYDVDQSGSPYTGKTAQSPSPIDVGNVTSFTLTAPQSLTKPIVSTIPGYKRLVCFWNPVAGASGYKLFYSTTSGSLTNEVDVGNNTSYAIENLTNKVTYYITVQAYSGQDYYLDISAYDGSGNESALINEVQAQMGAPTVGELSDEVSDFPENVVPFPTLKDESRCFIATAAYGSSMEREVVVLRKFRNHFLLTSETGRKFVELYYRYSPPLAEFIENNQWLRPVVRAGLYPVAGLAGLCLKARPMPAFAMPGLITAAFFLTFIIIRNIRRP